MRFDRESPPQQRLAIGGRVEGVCVSDRPIEFVRPGWFLHLVGSRVHWYDPVKVDGRRMLRRLCDNVAALPANLFEPGSFPSCGNCRKIIKAAEGP